jgi:DNA-3-methyladenine glycosylase I
MSKDAIIGPDGKPRCSWAGAGETALSRYHDEVCGTRTYDEHAMFEALTLGVFEVGLSWWSCSEAGRLPESTPRLRRHQGGGDDHARRRSVGRGRLDHPQPSQDPGDYRQRPRDMSASPTLAKLAKSYEVTRKRSPRSIADLPSSTPEAEAFAKQLKSQGYRFVGPTSAYAFMQNVGVVNDHVRGCFRAVDYPEPSSSR